MALYTNGSKIKDLAINGQLVSTAYCNGQKIYGSVPPLPDRFDYMYWTWGQWSDDYYPGGMNIQVKYQNSYFQQTDEDYRLRIYINTGDNKDWTNPEFSIMETYTANTGTYGAYYLYLAPKLATSMEQGREMVARAAGSSYRLDFSDNVKVTNPDTSNYIVFNKEGYDDNPIFRVYNSAGEQIGFRVGYARDEPLRIGRPYLQEYTTYTYVKGLV
jgi:hypothetical protein